MFSYIKALIDLHVPSVEIPEEEEGQGMVEYGLILALVSIAAIAALILVGDNLVDLFNDVVGGLQGNAPGGDND